MVGRQVRDQLTDACSELVGEVGSCRADEGVDVVASRRGHDEQPNGGRIGANFRRLQGQAL